MYESIAQLILNFSTSSVFLSYPPSPCHSLPSPPHFHSSTPPCPLPSSFTQWASDFPAVFLFHFPILPSDAKARAIESHNHVQKGKEYMKTFKNTTVNRARPTEKSFVLTNDDSELLKLGLRNTQPHRKHSLKLPESSQYWPQVCIFLKTLVSHLNFSCLAYSFYFMLMSMCPPQVTNYYNAGPVRTEINTTLFSWCSVWWGKCPDKERCWVGEETLPHISEEMGR